MNTQEMPLFSELVFFLLGALIVWLFSRVKIKRLTNHIKTYEEQFKQVSEIGQQLKNQLEQKDQTISRFISQLNRIGPGNDKRTIISIKKFETQNIHRTEIPIKS